MRRCFNSVLAEPALENVSSFQHDGKNAVVFAAELDIEVRREKKESLKIKLSYSYLKILICTNTRIPIDPI